MRQRLSIALTLVFAFNVIGGLSMLCMHKYRMHERIEQIIRGKNYSGLLTHLKFSPAESDALNWYKDGHEFRYKDEMYDVVRTETTADSEIIYHCIKDEKESDLYKDIERDLTSSEEQNGSNNFALQLFNFLSHMYFADPVSVNTIVSDVPRRPQTQLDFFPVVYGQVACEPPDVA